MRIWRALPDDEGLADISESLRRSVSGKECDPMEVFALLGCLRTKCPSVRSDIDVALKQFFEDAPSDKSPLRETLKPPKRMFIRRGGATKHVGRRFYIQSVLHFLFMLSVMTVVVGILWFVLWRSSVSEAPPNVRMASSQRVASISSEEDAHPPSNGDEEVVTIENEKGDAIPSDSLTGGDVVDPDMILLVEADFPDAIAADRARAEKRLEMSKPEMHTFDQMPVVPVEVVDPENAGWCILKRETNIKHIDGDDWRRLPAGTFFVIDKRMTDDSGRLELFGYIPPKNLLARPPLRLPIGSIRCFSGSPEYLSVRQKKDLQEFFEIEDKMAARRFEVLRSNYEKAPHLRRAVDATVAFRKKAEEFEKIKGGARLGPEELRKWTYKLSALRVAAEEANADHRKWKQKNGSLLSDPDQDPLVKGWRERQREIARGLPGLVSVPR